MSTIWLRNEVKENEQRTALTPVNAKKIIDAGHKVIVEESKERIFNIKEYQQVGCEIVASDSWRTQAPDDAYILGLKELPLNIGPLKHKHIYFAHIFKGQEDSQKVFNQYKQGQGYLFDLEFLLNEDKRRVAAFGYWAGYVGAALSVETYCHKMRDMKSPRLIHYKNKTEWIDVLSNKLQDISLPSAIIIGAKGRVGSGAKALFTDLGINNVTSWDYEETQKGGPFKEILDHDIFINSVLMTQKIPPFLDLESIKGEKQLKVIGDVSCDPNSDLNPIPIYNEHTTWENPTIEVDGVSVIAIDNLPSALPRESSEDFSEQLIPHLLNLCNEGENDIVWKQAKETFDTKKATY
jgi:saccharopine dehydrogenase (NAD+, L-lysine-forming)